MRKIVLAETLVKPNPIFETVVKAIQDAGIPVKKAKYWHIIGNDIFSIFPTRDGSVGFNGGEGGLLGDEQIGYDLFDLFEGITEVGKPLDTAIKKAIVILKKEIKNAEQFSEVLIVKKYIPSLVERLKAMIKIYQANAKTGKFYLHYAESDFEDLYKEVIYLREAIDNRDAKSIKKIIGN